MAELIRQGDIPGVQLRYRHQIAANPRQVWEWLTQAQFQTRWLAERMEPEAAPKAGVVLETTDPNGGILRERWTTIVSTPPSTWAVDLQNLDGTWPVPTRVVIELIPMADGTELSVLQKGFAHLPLSDCLTIWEAYRRRWRTCLTTLAQKIANP